MYQRGSCPLHYLVDMNLFTMYRIRQYSISIKTSITYQNIDVDETISFLNFNHWYEEIVMPCDWMASFGSNLQKSAKWNGLNGQSRFVSCHYWKDLTNYLTLLDDSFAHHDFTRFSSNFSIVVLSFWRKSHKWCESTSDYKNKTKKRYHKENICQKMYFQNTLP